jgi:hypothetical protein
MCRRPHISRRLTELNGGFRLDVFSTPTPCVPSSRTPWPEPRFPLARRPSDPPGVRVLTPLPTSVDHRYPLNQHTNVLPKRRGLT